MEPILITFEENGSLSAEHNKLLAQLIKEQQTSTDDPLKTIKLKRDHEYLLHDGQQITLSDSIIGNSHNQYMLIKRKGTLGTGSEARVKRVPYEIKLAGDTVTITPTHTVVKIHSESEAKTPNLQSSEASVLKQLHPEATITTLSRDTTAKGPKNYLFEPEIAGKDLYRTITEKQPRSKPNTDLLEETTIIIKLFEAVSALHAQGFIHMDLKPENVMVNRKADGTIDIQLIDLSMASEIGGKESISSGTPAYMLDRFTPDTPVTTPNVNWDLFALGIICMEILGGNDSKMFLGTYTTANDLVLAICKEITKKIAQTTNHDPSFNIADHLGQEIANAIANNNLLKSLLIEARFTVTKLSECVDRLPVFNRLDKPAFGQQNQSVKQVIKSLLAQPPITLEEAIKPFVKFGHEALHQRITKLQRYVDDSKKKLHSITSQPDSAPLLEATKLRSAFEAASQGCSNLLKSPSQPLSSQSLQQQLAQYNKMCSALSTAVNEAPKTLNWFKVLLRRVKIRFLEPGSERRATLEKTLHLHRLGKIAKKTSAELTTHHGQIVTPVSEKPAAIPH